MDYLIGLYAAINAFALFITLLLCIDGANFSYVNPKVIYNNIKVNWFGAWFIAIVSNIALPIIAIPYWIYKLFTVGR